ncbi:E4 SUMO-protein ligase PIAL2 isoform X2 [Senna tora]|uniref:E4 SUMO-protein ligase PIAL2 isoform X2 n=1 Tax=Senna tora TaxID=362788 RepID=A0A834WQM4_9FABA|nr:E4 SUMO-protein ligase PIAL2 isoform X2 [Senna tora]
MSGTVLPKTQFAGLSPALGNQVSPSVVNSYRISAVADRLAMHLQPGNHCDAAEFINLCLSLSRDCNWKEIGACVCCMFALLGLETWKTDVDNPCSSAFLVLFLDRDKEAVEPEVVWSMGLLLDWALIPKSKDIGIDYALANNEIPSKAQDLPILLKQVEEELDDNVFEDDDLTWQDVAIASGAEEPLRYSRKRSSTQAPTPRMAKKAALASSSSTLGDLDEEEEIEGLEENNICEHACKLGWFPRKESEELLTISDEIGKSYCSTWGVNAGTNHLKATISTLTERFYPKMKVGQILASLEVKPGYGAFATDFHISKNTAHSPHDKIWLLVAQTDNLETAACIITPQQVSFLLNGKGVDRRTNVIMDPGPQLPTNVTGMLKYGTNLLQAVGQFNGHYLILVAFMTTTSLPENPVIPEYVQPAVTSLGSDWVELRKVE